jgi:hypothetical protein
MSGSQERLEYALIADFEAFGVRRGTTQIERKAVLKRIGEARLRGRSEGGWEQDPESWAMHHDAPQLEESWSSSRDRSLNGSKAGGAKPRLMKRN